MFKSFRPAVLCGCADLVRRLAALSLSSSLAILAMATIVSPVGAQVPARDFDGDGVSDGIDNCYQLSNPEQTDTDGDGFGNACDGDFNGDGAVTALDFGSHWYPSFLAGEDDGTGTDMNGDGAMTTVDFAPFLAQLKTGRPGPGIRPEAFVEKGWLPSPDGPLWTGYLVDGDRVNWGGDVFFDLPTLRAFQAGVTKPRPIEVVAYDIDNGMNNLDDAYVGGTGDPTVGSTEWGGLRVERLTGGLGKLADGAAANSDTPTTIRNQMTVNWWSLGTYVPGPMIFHFDEPVEIGSIVLHGYGLTDLEITIDGQTISHSVPYSQQPRRYPISASGGLGLTADSVTIRATGNHGLSEVEFFGMRPANAPDEPIAEAVTGGTRVGWTDGIVPVEFVGFSACPVDSSCPYGQMLEAIDHWEENTIYRFPPSASATPRMRINYCRANDQSTDCQTAREDGICFVKDGVGRPGSSGVRDVFVHPNGCGFGTSVHEIGHAIGLYHEQSHGERDAYISVNWDNLEDWAAAQYTMKGVSFGEYNYRSIMHYPTTGGGRRVCCSVPNVDTSQNGMPNECSWFDDVSVETTNSSGNTVEMCPTPALGSMLNLPYSRGMEAFTVDVGLPIERADVRVGQREELSKADITAANALVLGDYDLRERLSYFDVAMVDFASGSLRYDMGDLNEDGRDDLVGFADGGIQVALGQSDGSFEDMGNWMSGVWCEGDRFCTVGDPDGNGRDDVVSFHENGQVEVFWSNGTSLARQSGSEVSHPTFGRRAAYGSGFYIADVNGDCVDDAIAIDRDQYSITPGYGITVRVALSTGGRPGAFEDEELGWFPAAALGSNPGNGISVGDVNHDGMADLQMGRMIYLSTGTGFAAPTEWAPSGFAPDGWCSNVTCRLADVNDDGWMDLVEQSNNGSGHLDRVRYALSNGLRFRTDVPNYHEVDCRNRNTCLLGDVDGDGALDVIDATHWELYPADPDRDDGDVWVSRARKVWSDPIAPMYAPDPDDLSIINQCGGSPFPGPILNF